MSTILNFLQSVLPASAKYFCAVAVDPRTGRLAQRAVTSHEELATVVGKAAAKGYDAFFALSGFQQGWHDDPGGRLDKNDAVKKVFRTQANAYAMRALWLDLDVGADPKKYPSQSAAVTGLMEFCSRTGMPQPYIVNSGGGIHVYWRFMQDVSVAQWRLLSAALDAVVTHAGVLADPSRTMDAASILRPVGTTNWKPAYGPSGAAVTTVARGEETTPTVVAGILSRYMSTHGLQPTGKGNSPAQHLPVAASGNLRAMMNNPAFRAAMGHVMEEAKDKDPLLILQGCQQVREAGLEAEPVWFAMMTVMKCCRDGEVAARVISAKDTRRFDEQQFIQKFRYVNGLPGGPESCEGFNRKCPGKCVACPHYGKITTPAELGRPQHNITHTPSPVVPVHSVATATAAPVVQGKAVAAPLPQVTSIAMPKIQGFEQVDGEGIYRIKAEKDENGDTKFTKMLVLPQCVYLVGKQEVHHGFAQLQTIYIWQIVEPNGQSRQAQMLAEEQNSTAALSKWCVNNQLAVLPHLEESRNTFMRSLIAHLQRKIPGVRVTEQFGWTEARSTEGVRTQGFSIGSTLFMPGTLPTTVILKPALEKFAVKRFSAMGSLEVWKRIPEFYHRNNMLAGQLALCMAFGAILMEFAPGSVQNSLVCLWGPSGSGKTTVMRAVNSVWGHPEQLLQRAQDTENSKGLVAGLMRNLPLCIDEVTKMTPKDMSDLVFMISEGCEKGRMKAEGGLQTSLEWRTLTLVTANHSICDVMTPYLQTRDAEVKRVLELYAGERSQDSTRIAEARDMERIMGRNYGQAGPYFVQRLLDSPAFIAKLPDILDEALARYSEVQDERFWNMAIAAAMVAGRMAKRMGLLPFDMDALERFAVQSRNQQRRTLFNIKSDGVSLLSDFLSDRLRDTLIVASKDRQVKTNGDMPLHSDSYVLRFPPQTGNVDVRIEADSNTAYVRCAALHDWCRERTITPRNILAELAAEGVYDALADGGKGFMKVRLGRGVKAFSHVTPARTYVFNLKDFDVTSLAESAPRLPGESHEIRDPVEQS